MRECGRWIQSCIENHPACKISTGPGKPARLVQLSLKDSVWHICLHDTDPLRSYEYVALSHCWSLSEPLRTVKENLAQHRDHISIDAMSAVYKDAILLTWTLNIDYLWIDSLCIVQNDADEWALESVKMGDIYNNAIVVFAAQGAHMGLRKNASEPIKDPQRPDDPPIFCRRKVDHRNFFVSAWGRSPWFTRGWCLQERILARRLLLFGGMSDENFFECGEYLTCECGRAEESRDKSTLRELYAMVIQIPKEEQDQIDEDWVWKLYIRTCEEYTARNLTFPTDTMPAISSLMRVLEPYLGTYLAGIYEHNLILALQ